LGDNSTIDKSSPVQTISQGTNWKQVASGGRNVGAIKTDGTLWVWGFNNSGQLGINSTIDQSSPVQTVTTGTNWKQVGLGCCHSAAIKTDGTLWLWGTGTNGILGNNSTLDRSSPVQTVTTGTDWKQVSLGNAHSAAIREYCW
jgi:alpha-tubulin suppressor-like RCC1 family protein